MRSIWNDIKGKLARLLERLRPRVRIDAHAIFAVAIRVFLIVLFAVLQTTVFVRFRLFSSTPDLVLAVVLAIAIRDKMIGGAAYGVLAGFIIDSIGAVGFAPNPLFLGAIGLFAGYFSQVRFSDNIAVRAIYIVAAALLKSMLTLMMCALTINGFVLSEVFVTTVMPEFFTTVIFCAVPFSAVWLCTRSLDGRKNGEMK